MFVESQVTISARENASVKLYRKLAASRKDRKREGLFVLEGQRLVWDALQNGAQMTHLFWTEDGYAKWCMEHSQSILEETRCAFLSDALGKELSQTEHSQGVYGICRIPKALELDALIEAGKNYAVLHQLQDPGNAGMILRTADALGLDGVIYSASCDIYSPKVVRATMGSLFRVPICCVSDIAPVLGMCRARGVESCAAVVDDDAQPVGQCDFTGGTAVVIGNEGNGLPWEVSAACDRRITIPMHGTIESLNAAMAAGIILWEVQKGRG